MYLVTIHHLYVLFYVDSGNNSLFCVLKLMGTAILTARKAASVIALRRLQAPAGGRWQARDTEQRASRHLRN